MTSTMMGYGINPSGSISGQKLQSGGKGGFNDKIPSGYKSAQLQQFTPEQLELFQSLFGHLLPEGYLSKLAGGDESLFNEIEAPALRQFSELQGNLASRFSGMGMGARNSSGFQNTSNQAASDFAQQLQSNRQGLQQQALDQLMGLSGQLLNQKPYERQLVAKDQNKSSGWGGLAGAALGGAGGFFAGGPAGALSGAKLGYNVGNSF